MHPSTLQLLENASDSLKHGVRHYLSRDQEPTRIKHAVLSIYHSIELFLKARLALAHPVLLYRNLDKPITAESQTVWLAELIGRLENVGTPLTPHHARLLREFQARRNRIEHFAFDFSAPHDSLAGQALNFLLEFLPILGLSLEAIINDQANY